MTTTVARMQIAAGRPIAVLPCPSATGSVIRSGDSGGSSAPVTIQVLLSSIKTMHVVTPPWSKVPCVHLHACLPAYMCFCRQQWRMDMCFQDAHSKADHSSAHSYHRIQSWSGLPCQHWVQRRVMRCRRYAAGQALAVAAADHRMAARALRPTLAAYFRQQSHRCS